MAAELLLLRQAELLVGGAGGEDDGRRLVRLTGCRDHTLEVAGELDLGDVVEHHLRAELLGLLLEPVHQLGALDAAGEAGEVFHFGGVHQGTAGRDRTGDDQRLQARTGGVDGGGVAGGAGPDDDQLFRLTVAVVPTWRRGRGMR